VRSRGATVRAVAVGCRWLGFWARTGPVRQMFRGGCLDGDSRRRWGSRSKLIEGKLHEVLRDFERRGFWRRGGDEFRYTS